MKFKYFMRILARSVCSVAEPTAEKVMALSFWWGGAMVFATPSLFGLAVPFILAPVLMKAVILDKKRQCELAENVAALEAAEKALFLEVPGDDPRFDEMLVEIDGMYAVLGVKRRGSIP